MLDTVSTDNKKASGWGISLNWLLIWGISLAGAAGIALQNFMAFQLFLNSLGRLTVQTVLGISGALGGAVSGLVNLCMNLELLNDFLSRFKKGRVKPKLEGWKKFRYYFGSFVFIATGILFGLAALAFGGSGILAGLGLGAGILVSIIMIFQELETWLQSFDGAEAQKKSLKKIFNDWLESLKKPKAGISKAAGFLISVGNVLALSLLFAFGLSSFLIGIAGVPAVPAIIGSLVVAFTVGAFTEFYFYNYFLSKFCEDIVLNWKEFLKLSSAKMSLAVLSSAINAAVNGVLCAATVASFNFILLSAGMSAIPLGIIVTASVFCALASFILGTTFWTKFWNKPEAPKASTDSVVSNSDNTEVGTHALSPSGAMSAMPVVITAKNKQGVCVAALYRAWAGLFASATYAPIPGAPTHSESDLVVSP